MLFGRKPDAVATPRPDASQRPADGVATGQPPLSLVQPPEPSVRELLRAVQGLHDDQKWLGERFDKLQNRVTTELREIRREVDRFYDEPEEQ